MTVSYRENLRRVIRRMTLLFLVPLLIGCVASRGISPPVSEVLTPTSTPTLTLTPEPTATLTPTQIPALCGGPRVMFILLIGSDARSNSYKVGLADAIRIVRVDFVEPGVQALAFPRDLYVEIPGIESHQGITHGKLNQAFLYGNPGYEYYDDPDLGPGLLAETLAHNFGADSDHYVSVNLQTFTKTVDAIGGIDIDLPYEVDGRVKGSKDNRLYFQAGNQHLSGFRTMLLARMRPDGDLKRNEVQNLILQSVVSKLLDPEMLTRLPELAETFKGSVQTDFSPVEIGQLACLAALIDIDKVEFMSFPDELFESARVRDPVLGNTSILKADIDILRSYVQRFELGNWNIAVKHDQEIAP